MGGRSEGRRPSEGMLVLEDPYPPCHQHCYLVSTSPLAATLKRFGSSSVC